MHALEEKLLRLSAGVAKIKGYTKSHDKQLTLIEHQFSKYDSTLKQLQSTIDEMATELKQVKDDNVKLRQALQSDSRSGNDMGEQEEHDAQPLRTLDPSHDPNNGREETENLRAEVNDFKKREEERDRVHAELAASVDEMSRQFQELIREPQCHDGQARESAAV
ncbi:unnamed protein product [Sympodiomycopsis kandeliae]